MDKRLSRPPRAADPLSPALTDGEPLDIDDARHGPDQPSRERKQPSVGQAAAEADDSVVERRAPVDGYFRGPTGPTCAAARHQCLGMTGAPGARKLESALDLRGHV